MTTTTETLTWNGRRANIIRTNRKKTATVKVEEGCLSIVVPQTVTIDKIQRLLKSKDRWIRENLVLQSKHKPPKPKEYVSGECFTYLGRNYRLKVQNGPKQPVKLKNGRLLVSVPPGSKDQDKFIKNALATWYKEHARTKLQDKVVRYSKLLNVQPQSVGVRTFKSRWGSCSAKGRVEFNWAIIMAPNSIVDYVVIHELCHLKHHNHGPQFWKALGRVLPDYKASKEWLKVNGRQLAI